jgi:hypothetical protein
MLGMMKKAAGIIMGNRVFQVPSLEYVGTDSVLRLGPVDYRQWLNDVAGGGHIAGYSTWQGAPSNIILMGPTNAAQGGGVVGGFGAQPGALANPPQAVQQGSQ